MVLNGKEGELQRGCQANRAGVSSERLLESESCCDGLHHIDDVFTSGVLTCDD